MVIPLIALLIPKHKYRSAKARLKRQLSQVGIFPFIYPFFNVSSRVRQESTAHFTLAGMWEMLFSAIASSSSSSSSSSVISPLIILRNKSAKCSAFSTDSPFMRSIISEVDACEIAQLVAINLCIIKNLMICIF